MSLNLKKCFVLKIVAAFGETSSSGLLAAPTDVIVKIGHAAPLTGGASHLGKDDENGARLAIEEINARGLVIGGKKITWNSIPKTMRAIHARQHRLHRSLSTTRSSLSLDI